VPFTSETQQPNKINRNNRQMGAVVVVVVILSMGISIKFIVVVAGDLSPSIKCVCVCFYFSFGPTHFRTRTMNTFSKHDLFVVRD